MTARTTDLKSLAPHATKDSVVTLTYTAHLDPTLATPGTGDPADNYVYINYTSKPWTDAIGRTVEDQAQLLTWAIDVHKVNANQSKNLAGAVFTVQDAWGAYVRADGTTSAEVVEHTTDEQGVISIRGVDAGSYTVTEVRAPKGYQKLDKPFTVVIHSRLQLDASHVDAQVTGDGVKIESIGDAEGGVRLAVLNAAIGEPPVGPLVQTGDAIGAMVGLLVFIGVGVCAAGFALVTRPRSK